jgi:predicted permease
MQPSIEPSGNSDSWLIRIGASVAGDLRQSVRRLPKEAGFTTVVLLTLALCIGATTAIFSLVYALLLKPLPFAEPTRIVEIYNSFPKAGLQNLPSNVIQYLDFKAHAPAFENVGLCGLTTNMVGDEGAAERTVGANCTADLFDVLRLKPVIGQFFTQKNSTPGEDQVVVLTQSFWESHFNESPDVLGQAVKLDGQTFHIIGVAPRTISAFDARINYLRPVSWKPDSIQPRGRYSLGIALYGRLKPGASVSQGLSEVAALEQHYYDAAPGPLKEFLDRSGHKIIVELVQAERVEPLKASLYLLQGGVVFVLLIGCVNVANLLLTRSNGRQSDLAIRSALGASQGAIARQLIIESLVLTLLGSALGIGLALGAVRAINHYTLKLLPNMLPVAIDGRVLGFTVILSIAVGLGIGLLPVLHILGTNLAQVINRTSRGASGGRRVRALSNLLVIGQVAVALVLLTGAGLLIHSFANALAVNPGFDPRNMVTSRIALPGAYRTPAASAGIQRQILQALQEIPGVQDATLSASVPVQGGLPINALTIKENALPRNSPQPGAYIVAAAVGYFQALHIQLLEGRFFEPPDNLPDRHVYVVDENFAKRYYPGRSAVGCHFTFGGVPAKDTDWPVIIGVVRAVPHNGVEDKSNIPFVYTPLMATGARGLSMFVRTSRPFADTSETLRAAVRRINPGIPIFDTQTLQQAIDGSFDNRRAVMLLLCGFAVLALFLSAIGIYGVLAYDVSQRTREIGIRGAIGASREQIVGLIMRQGLWKTGIGLAVGLVSALLLSRTMTNLLFNLKPTDPWTYLAVAAVLAVVATLASYLPARRASRIDPIEALRVE